MIDAEKTPIVTFMKSIGIDGKTNDEGIFVATNTSKITACNRLMKLLIIADYFYLNDVRWFLNPIETALYRPAKEL